MQEFSVAHQPQPAIATQEVQLVAAEQPAQHAFATIFVAKHWLETTSFEIHLFEEEHQLHTLDAAHCPQFVKVEQKSKQSYPSTNTPEKASSRRTSTKFIVVPAAS